MKKLLMLCLLVVASGSAFADKIDVVNKPVNTSPAATQESAIEIDTLPIFSSYHSPFLTAIQAINESLGQILYDSAVAYQSKCSKPATIGWAKIYLKSENIKLAETLFKQEKSLIQQCKDSHGKGDVCNQSVQDKYIDTVTNVKCSADVAVSDKAGGSKPGELKQMTDEDIHALGEWYFISPNFVAAAHHVASECRLYPTRAVIRAMGDEKHPMQSFVDAAAAKHDNKEMPPARKEDCQALLAVAKL
jgi:hypothetical protein